MVLPTSLEICPSVRSDAFLHNQRIASGLSCLFDKGVYFGLFLSLISTSSIFLSICSFFLESLEQVINLIDSKNKSEKLRLVEKMNVRRNYEILMQFKQYGFLNEHQDYLEKLFQSVMAIDFSVMANVNESEVSNQKQLLYHEALQEII